MKFNSNWSQAYLYDPDRGDRSFLNDCRGKAGIYAISDEFDQQPLYVGKAEGTSRDIASRLQAHLDNRGNRGIGDLVGHHQKLVIRWAESERPSLAESVAIVQLTPLFNKRGEWQSIDAASLDECIRESERLGLTAPGTRDRALDKLAREIARQIYEGSDRPFPQDIARNPQRHISLDRSLDRTKRF